MLRADASYHTDARSATSPSRSALRLSCARQCCCRSATPRARARAPATVAHAAPAASGARIWRGVAAHAACPYGERARRYDAPMRHAHARLCALAANSMSSLTRWRHRCAYAATAYATLYAASAGMLRQRAARYTSAAAAPPRVRRAHGVAQD